jgi:hypothetical protein
MRVQRLWSCLPPALLCSADGLITLWGQPAAYWSGGFRVVCEGNPLAAWLLTVHPLAFAAAGVPYLLVVAGTIMVLPRRWAAAVAIGIASTHAFAVAVWCLVLFREPLLPLIAVALVLAGSGAVAWQFGWRAESIAGSGQPGN